ncbi:MAG: DNA polymerase III subunit delta [Candidatus Neomarinimicrobiota bacterium]
MAAYEESVRTVRDGKIGPVYLLAGDDVFLQDFFIGEVASQFLPSGVKKRVFSIDDDGAAKVMAELDAYSLFQERQVLVVRNAQGITGKPRDELLAYVKNPQEDKCLLLVREEYQPSQGLQKFLSKAVPVVDTRPPFADKMRRWADFYARSRNMAVEPEALDLLMELVGDSSGHVVSELEKIFSQLDDGGTVTRELVEAQVGPEKSYQLWQLQAAVAKRELAPALRISVALLEYGTQATRIIGALAALFGQLLFVQTGTAAENAYTGLNKPVSAGLGRMGRLYRAPDTAAALRALLAADTRLKSTGVDPGSVIVGLVAEICGERGA